MDRTYIDASAGPMARLRRWMLRAFLGARFLTLAAPLRAPAERQADRAMRYALLALAAFAGAAVQFFSALIAGRFPEGFLWQAAAVLLLSLSCFQFWKSGAASIDGAPLDGTSNAG